MNLSLRILGGLLIIVLFACSGESTQSSVTPTTEPPASQSTTETSSESTERVPETIIPIQPQSTSSQPKPTENPPPSNPLGSSPTPGSTPQKPPLSMIPDAPDRDLFQLAVELLDVSIGEPVFTSLIATI